MNTNISQYLLAIINALGIPARIIPGILADRFGVYVRSIALTEKTADIIDHRLNVLVPCSIASGIFVFALWLPSRSTGPIVAFSALYGLFSGKSCFFLALFSALY